MPPNRRAFNIRVKIIIGYLLVIACLGAFLWVVSGRMAVLHQEADFIGRHDIEVHRLAHEIEKSLLELENGQRGFVITGDPEYLEPYEEALSTWESDYNKLIRLIENNDNQINDLAAIKNNIEKWIETAGQPAVRIKQAGQDEEALQFFINDPGKSTMDVLRNQFTVFRTAERELTAARVDQMKSRNLELLWTMYGLWSGIALATLAGAFIISRTIVKPINQVSETIREIAKGGNLSRRIVVTTRDEVYTLAEETNKLLESVSRQAWIKDQVTAMTTLLQNADKLDMLTRFFTHRAARVLGAPYAALFLQHEDQHLMKASAFADPDGEPWNKVRDRFQPGEGLVGQCAVEKRILTFEDVPSNYVRIESGLGDAEPSCLIVAPIMTDDNVEAVLELALFKPLDAACMQLMEQLLHVFGQALGSMKSKLEIQKLYRESQALNEELQLKSEELQAQTEELQSQTEELQVQSAETRQLNHELEAQKNAALFAASEIERYAEQVEQGSKYKSQFLTNMSHELRTPLNSMMILSQILSENKNGNLSEEEQNYASVIHKSGTELLNLINDILDLSKVEAGKLQIEMDMVNVTELPEMVVNQFGKQAEEKNLQLSVHIEPDVPDAFCSDGLRLHQILRNLLSNAIKFTESGGVALSIAMLEETAAEGSRPQGRMIAFKVTDTGIGIAEENLAPVFEAFRQGDESTARKYGGTGLGLTISLQLARMLGGHLEAQSKVGEGSTFTLLLPARPPALLDQQMFSQPEAATSLESGSPPSDSEGSGDEDGEEGFSDEPVNYRFEGQTVLIVDDDIRNVYGLANALEKANLNVLTAQHGDEGLDILASGEQVDIVLMDRMMPKLDGLQALTRLRQVEAYEQLPVIMLSARANDEDEAQCRAAGADAYIMKPIQLSEIFAEMHTLMKRADSEMPGLADG
ncbi:CHASE3 domain-containing protein [Paenibacillus sp. F411]|uniref:CHASE3 domain-containing protein n=1 Tax=Paenibacillus sp. F411 TaxID=2820239 RepID=UPI001FB89C88|nr:CHASE3 domain-containing protein [Paenibacillus sp. F411]